MFSSAELHVAYQIANAPIRPFPYPHCFVEDVFPSDFYADIQRNLPDPSAMIPIEEARQVQGYKERFVLELHKPDHLDSLPSEKRAFWRGMSEWMTGGQHGKVGRFGQFMMNKFAPYVEARFKGQTGLQFYDEAFLVEDVTNYKLGPHTDSPVKVITMLFYLPNDMSQAHLGTSVYQPKDLTFRCQGGPHYPFDWFQRMVTMPFKPNSLFTFVKGDNSFHGVEPVGDPDTRRWLLLFDVFVLPTQPAQATWRAQVQYGSVPAQPPSQPARPPGSKFTF